MKQMGCYHQGQGHSECLYNQNMTVSTNDSFATKLSLMLHYYKLGYFVKYCIAVFKVILKIQIFTESVTVWMMSSKW